MSVEWGIVTSVVPPRGWHYVQLLAGGEKLEIKGFSFEELLKNILEFRERHLELCGGAAQARAEVIREDLRKYICAHFKQNCASASTSALAPGHIGTRTNYVSPIEKGADWLAAVGQSRPELIDAALANQRAQICVQCPQNVSWVTACTPCNSNVLARIQNAKGNLHTAYDRRLGVCRLLGQINEVAVWLRDTRSSADNLPSHCWKLTNGN